MPVAVYALRKYSKYSTAHSGCWNATDHTLNCIYSLETLSPQQQLLLPPHPKRCPVAPGDSSGLPAHRDRCPTLLSPYSDCKLYFQAQGLLFTKEWHIRCAFGFKLLQRKSFGLLQSCSMSFKTIQAALIIFN